MAPVDAKKDRLGCCWDWGLIEPNDFSLELIDTPKDRGLGFGKQVCQCSLAKIPAIGKPHCLQESFLEVLFMDYSQEGNREKITF